MKLFTSLLLIFFIATFSSCESYRQTDGEVANGTPSRADTVLPHKYPPMQEAKASATEEPAGVFKR